MKRVVCTAVAALAASPAFAFSHSLSVPDAMHRAEHALWLVALVVVIAGICLLARHNEH